MDSPRAPRGTRTGFTTGACAAAAARAAVLGLVHGTVPTEVKSLLPNGERVRFAVHHGRCDGRHAHAMVVKFAGDDPDVTDGAHLTADVTVLPDAPGQVRLEGGVGVGRVTLDGLGLTVGGPAINPVPRRNIEDNVREAAAGLLDEVGLAVTISVPQGEAMARKTINARLGILGGISILGTTGIVKPYSTAAYRASVVQGVRMAAALGHGTVVLTTGGRTEACAMREYAHLPAGCFVQMGDFLRYALDEVVACGLPQVVIGGMAGKLAKIAQGETITHAGRAEVDTALLADLAAGLGASAAVCAEIAAAKTARFAAERLEALGLGLAFHEALARQVIHTLRTPNRYGERFALTVLVCHFEGRRITEIPHAACAAETP